MWRIPLLNLFFNTTQTLFLCVHGITPKMRWSWCIFCIAFLHRNEPNIFTHWNEYSEGKHVKHLVLDNKLRHIIIFRQFSNIHCHSHAPQICTITLWKLLISFSFFVLLFGICNIWRPFSWCLFYFMRIYERIYVCANVFCRPKYGKYELGAIFSAFTFLVCRR